MAQWANKKGKIVRDNSEYVFEGMFSYPSTPFTIPNSKTLPDFCSINSLQVNGKECTLEQENEFIKWCKENLRNDF